MRHALLARFLACLLLALGGCMMAAEKPAPAPPPLVVPPIEPEEVPPAPIVLPTPQPAPKPAARSKAKTRAEARAEAAKASAGLPVPPAPALTAEPVPPAAAVSAPAQSAPQTPPKKAAAPIQGPAWLAACVRRQQSSVGIQCDSDSLLAPPSASVRVYTREPDLAQETPGGRIRLRESLPNRYRLYVIP